MIKNELIFLLKHSSIYGIGSMIGRVVGFILLPLYTRFLTPSDYGVMSLVDITMNLVGIVVGLGATVAMSRFYFDYNTEKERKLVVSTVFGVSFILTIISLPVLYSISSPISFFLFDSEQYTRIFQIAALSMLFGLNVDIGLTYLRIRTESKKYVIITLVRMVYSVALNIYFIAYLKTGIIGFFYAALIDKFTFFIIINVPILIKTKLFFSINLARKMIKFSFPLIFSGIFRVIVNESDKYFINYFFSPFETGIYSLAQKLGTAIHSFLTVPFLQTYMPRRFEIMKKEDVKSTYALILNYYLLAISSVGLMVALLADEIIRIMTTEEFYDSIKFVPLVVFSMIIFGLKYHFEIGIMIRKKTKYIAYINGVSSIVNIALNYFLIAKYKIWGALISINISYFLTVSLNYIFSQKLYNIKYDFRKIFTIFILIIFIYSISTFITYDNIGLNIVFKLCLFSLFFCLVGIFRIVDNEILLPAINNVIKFIKRLFLKDT